MDNLLVDRTSSIVDYQSTTDFRSFFIPFNYRFDYARIARKMCRCVLFFGWNFTNYVCSLRSFDPLLKYFENTLLYFICQFQLKIGKYLDRDKNP